MPWYLGFPTVKTCLAADAEFSCRLPEPESFESNGDIAGLGVFSAFAAASFLSFAAGVYGLIYEWIAYSKSSDRRYAKKTRPFIDVFLISLGDTQIITSIALLISANFAVGCSISAYHYNLVCDLVLISSAAHIGSIAFVHRYFSRSKTLGTMRFVLILVSFAFGWVLFAQRSYSEIFPMAKPDGGVGNINGTIDTGLVLPAACFLGHPGVSATTSYSNFTASEYWIMNITIATNSSTRTEGVNGSAIFTNSTTMPNFQQFSSNDVLRSNDIKAYAAMTVALIFTGVASIILAWTDDKDNRLCHWTAYTLRVVSFFTIYGVMAYGFSRFLILQEWMIGSGWFGGDNGESSLQSFGQLMPLVLLLLPILMVFEESAGRKGSSENNSNGKRSSDAFEL